MAGRLSRLRSRVSALRTRGTQKVKTTYNSGRIRRKFLRAGAALGGVAVGTATLNPLLGYGAYRYARRRLSTKADRAEWKAAKMKRKATAAKGRKQLGKVYKTYARTAWRAASGHYGRSGAKRARRWAGLD